MINNQTDRLNPLGTTQNSDNIGNDTNAGPGEGNIMEELEEMLGGTENSTDTSDDDSDDDSTNGDDDSLGDAFDGENAGN